MKYDAVVCGGSIGGILAAISLAKNNYNVLLTEETDWIGGQLTSQAVPFDEHKYIEEFGSTKSYRKFRNRIREFMKQNYPLTDAAMNNERLNPGSCSVSRLGVPPKVSLHVFYELLNPYLVNNKIELRLNTKAIKANVVDDEIKSIIIKDTLTNKEEEITAKYFLDGTDIGDLLPLVGCEYVTGSESRSETGEPNAPEVKDIEDMQPITWVLAMDYVEGEDHTIEKPEMYDFYKELYWPCDNTKVLSAYGPDSSTGKTKEFGVFTNQNRGLFPLYSYRQVINKNNFKNNFFDTNITLLNWPQNDYFLGNIFESEDDEKNKYMAKQLSLSLFYWLQTECITEDGRVGYKGLRLRPDVLGTEDGLAKYPYIRESRRIKALYTITENEINSNICKELPHYFDSVGVGSYHIDLHITTKKHDFFFFNNWPFEIPLGALIPVRIKNLIPACKNIGTTHLTNGCFRLHPVEWNIGEVAGHLASKAMEWNTSIKEIRNNEELLKKFQEFLDENGIERSWPEDKVTIS